MGSVDPILASMPTLYVPASTSPSHPCSPLSHSPSTPAPTPVGSPLDYGIPVQPKQDLRRASVSGGTLHRSFSRQLLPSNCIFGRGSTRVNRKLQEQVLREVFSSPKLNDWQNGKCMASRKASRRYCPSRSLSGTADSVQNQTSTTLNRNRKSPDNHDPSPSASTRLSHTTPGSRSDTESDTAGMRRVHSELAMSSRTSLFYQCVLPSTEGEQ